MYTQADLVHLLATKHSIHDTASIVIARNVTFGMASVNGSPGEIDILVCVKTGQCRDDALEGDSTSGVDEEHIATTSTSGGSKRLKRKNRHGRVVENGVEVKVLAIVEVRWLSLFSVLVYKM